MNAPSGRSVVMSESWKWNYLSSMGCDDLMLSDIIEMQTRAYPNTNDPKAITMEIAYR
jgi:hypothetical protein